MNVTVKVPQGGEYDVDVQAVKEKYVQWRKMVVWAKRLYLAFFFFLLVIVLQGIIPHGMDNFPIFPSLFQSFLPTLLWWALLLGVLPAGHFGLTYLYKKKAHFECPFPECNEEIRIYEPWECLQCRDDKVNYPTRLWWTFFDHCKRGHKPQSYQCPACRNEFELVPGGRKDKFAKLAIIHQESIPGDRFF